MRALVLAMLLSACSEDPAPRARPDAAPAAPAAPAPPAPAPAPAPAAPPPTRPFAAGDIIPEGFAREPEGSTGHAAFDAGLPIPWRCEVVSRTRTTLAARCDVSSGQARSFYQRLHRGFGRDMFGGVWNEEEQFAYFGRPRETGVRIHISADRERALYGAASRGAPLRVQHEPEGDAAADPAPGPDTSAEDLLLRAFGGWRCGSQEVVVGVRRIVIASHHADAVCEAVTAEAAGASRVRVRCRDVTGDHDVVLEAGAAARMKDPGIVLELGARGSLTFDGAACRRTSDL